VTAADAPRVLERMLRAYLAHRAGSEETFQDFVKRCPTEQLRGLFDRDHDVSAANNDAKPTTVNA
jgi:hypothetical protein